MKCPHGEVQEVARNVVREQDRLQRRGWRCDGHLNVFSTNGALQFELCCPGPGQRVEAGEQRSHRRKEESEGRKVARNKEEKGCSKSCKRRGSSSVKYCKETARVLWSCWYRMDLRAVFVRATQSSGGEGACGQLKKQYLHGECSEEVEITAVGPFALLSTLPDFA